MRVDDRQDRRAQVALAEQLLSDASELLGAGDAAASQRIAAVHRDLHGGGDTPMAARSGERG